MAECVTEGIRVRVESDYVEERSDPDRSFYFFRYIVQILNEGERTARLDSRHWIITDGNGGRQDVRGPGVVGEQPVLEPGQVFRYESFCPLPTPVGMMEGTYFMMRSDGSRFEVRIPTFSLVNPAYLS